MRSLHLGRVPGLKSIYLCIFLLFNFNICNNININNINNINITNINDIINIDNIGLEPQKPSQMQRSR